MLGEKLGEGRGKIIGTRVLETTPQPKVETTFESRGTILGMEMSEIGTYWTVFQPNGVLHGEGQGIITTSEGIATWKGSGTARTTGRAASFRGAIYYQTQVERLLRLNGMAAVFEFDVDENGNTQAKVFEWK